MLVSSSFGRLRIPATPASSQTARKANCPQKAISPKNGNASVIRLMKADTTAGVQTSSASAETVQGSMSSGKLEQSRTSPKSPIVWLQYR